MKNAVLRRVKRKCNFLYTIKRGKANWDGHILRRICFLHHVIEILIDGKKNKKKRRRRKQSLDYFKENRKYWKLKETDHLIALSRELALEKCYGPVVRQTAE